MKRFVHISTIMVLAFLVIQLLEANAKILWKINQVNFDNSFDVALSFAKALGYSLATVIITISYRSWCVRTLFIAIDMAVVFIYYHVTDDGWWVQASYAYPVYTGLIFLFVGQLAYKKMQTADQLKEVTSRLREKEIKEEIANLKRTGRNGTSWQTKPEIVKKINSLESELKSIKNGSKHLLSRRTDFSEK